MKACLGGPQTGSGGNDHFFRTKEIGQCRRVPETKLKSSLSPLSGLTVSRSARPTFPVPLFPWQGGLPAAYRIDRSQAKGPWEEAGTSATTEKIMANQPRGVDLSYRVIAVNKSGQGQPSGVVTAVL